MENTASGHAKKNAPCNSSAGPGWEAVVPNPKLKLLDQVRQVLRLRHYSIRTEQSYCDWIRPGLAYTQLW